MNQIYHKVHAIACSALLFASTVAVADSVNVSPFLNFRSPGTNAVSKVSATNAHKFLADMDGFYGFLDLNFSYERSFRPGGIAQSLFGAHLVDDRSIRVTGSAVENRAVTDLLADYFFLPRDFSGVIHFSPRVQNYVLFMEAYFGFDEWVPGLYLDVYGAVVNSRYNLDAEEVDSTAGQTGYAQGYFAKTAIAADQLNNRALNFLSGQPISIDGLTIRQLNFAKIKNESDKETAFSELRVEFGYNFWLEEDYHWGINLQVGFPTGNKPEAEFLFEAMPSSGKYFKLGGGTTGHYTLWRSDDGDHHLDIAMDLAVTHWFNGKQRRTFDLKGKPLSRYMLAEKMGGITSQGALLTSTDGGVTTKAPTPAVQFSGEYSPVANISTREVKVSVGAEVDLALWFVYMCKGWEFDLGYNFWYRSSEKIHLSDDQSAIPANTWALKGDAFVYGASDASTATLFTNTAVGLSATESGATINAGTSLSKNTDTFVNVAVDTPAPAFTTVEGAPAALFVTAIQQVNTSTNPVFITDALLDIEGAETRGLSNKVFGNFSYTWVNNENWIPVLALGFEGEFGRRHSGDHDYDNVNNNDYESGSRSVALSKWAVSIKLGVSFE